MGLSHSIVHELYHFQNVLLPSFRLRTSTEDRLLIALRRFELLRMYSAEVRWSIFRILRIHLYLAHALNTPECDLCQKENPSPIYNTGSPSKNGTTFFSWNKVSNRISDHLHCDRNFELLFAGLGLLPYRFKSTPPPPPPPPPSPVDGKSSVVWVDLTVTAIFRDQVLLVLSWNFFPKTLKRLTLSWTFYQAKTSRDRNSCRKS